MVPLTGAMNKVRAYVTDPNYDAIQRVTVSHRQWQRFFAPATTHTRPHGGPRRRLPAYDPGEMGFDYIVYVYQEQRHGRESRLQSSWVLSYCLLVLARALRELVTPSRLLGRSGAVSEGLSWSVVLRPRGALTAFYPATWATRERRLFPIG